MNQNGNPEARRHRDLDRIYSLKSFHTIWVTLQSIFGVMPLFALINKFRPILDDGYGGDLLPSLLPEVLASHYNLFLAFALAALATSELLRRRFWKKHADDFDLLS